MVATVTTVSRNTNNKTTAQNGACKNSRPDIWLRDLCVVCQSKHHSDADKEAHTQTVSHKKRVHVYDFFSKESGSLEPVNTSPVLLGRYKRSRTLALGLECLHELNMPFSSSPWWACSICYVAGANLDRIDEHVHSFGHKKIYIDEFHPDKSVSCSVDEVASMEKYHSIGLKILKEQGKYETPEVLRLNGVNKNWVLQKLGLEPSDELPNYTVEGIFGGHDALHCNVCHTILISTEETRQRCWSTHLSTSYHQRMQVIASAIGHFETQKVESPFSGTVFVNEWREDSGFYKGPVTGVQYLLYFGRTPYCRLCYSAVNVDAVLEHFCSENHIFKYLSSRLPGEMYMAMYLPENARRTTMQEMLGKLSKERLGGSPSKIEVASIPKLILDNSNVENLNFPPHMPPVLAFGCDQSCFWCPVCWRIVKVPAREDAQNQIWTEHVTKSRRHFQMAVRRGLFNFDDNNFTDLFSSLNLPHEKPEATWTKVQHDGVMVDLQKQCYVGLDWIVDDLDSNEVVCTACASIFPRSSISEISLHVKSMDHLMQYLHTANRPMFALVKAQKTSQAERDILMDFLRKSEEEITGKIRVHSVDLALRIENWGVVPCRTVELGTLNEEIRPIYSCLVEIIDTVADDLVETVVLPIKNALQSCSIRIHSIVTPSHGSSYVILWCLGCQHAFCSSEDGIIKNVWEIHLPSDEHMTRAAAFAHNKCDSGGFFEAKSLFIPPVVDQTASKKKITWRWNDALKKFDYIYTVVGFSDMIDRRSVEVGVPREPDIFCTLCAQKLAYSQAAVDLHVRSLEHVINYVHRHHTHRMKQLLEKQALNDNGKELRRFLGQLLKDECLSGDMRVYHPDGVQAFREEESRRIAAEQEAKRQREEARKRVEQRKKEFEAAMRREDELEKERRRKVMEERRREIEYELATRRREREKQQREEERRRKREEERKRKEEEEEKKKEEESKRRQKMLAAERERKKQEEERKAKQERERREREERIAMLQREEQEKNGKLYQLQQLTRAKQAEEERQRVMQMRMTLERERMELLRQQAQQRIMQDEKRIEHELMRIQQEKANLQQKMNMWKAQSQDYRAEREAVHTPLSVTIFNQRPSQMNPPFMSSPLRSSSVDMAISPLEMRSGGLYTAEMRPSSGAGPPISLLEIETHENELVREALLAKKAESFSNALKKIESREMLVDFLWKQGSEAIPESELPVLFNTVVSRRTNTIGLSSVYQVVCWDRQKLQTMYCSMCSVWTTVSEMLKHLITCEHRIHYLFRNYKMYHKSAMSQPNEIVRAQLLEQFAQQIWKLEGSGEVRYRLRCMIDYDTVIRLWPDHIRYLNDDWMNEAGSNRPSDDAHGKTPPPGIDNIGQQRKVEPIQTYEKQLVEREREKQVEKLKQLAREKEKEISRLREEEKEKLKEKEKDLKPREKERKKEKESSSKKSKIDASASGSGKSMDREKSAKSLARKRSRSRSRHRSRSRRHSRSASRSRRLRRSSSKHRLSLSRRRRSASHRAHKSRSRSHSRHRRSKSRSPAKAPLRLSTILDGIKGIEPKPVGEWSEATKAFLAKIGVTTNDSTETKSNSNDTSSRRHSRSHEKSVSRRHRSQSRSTEAKDGGGSRKQKEASTSVERTSLEERLETEVRAAGVGMKVWGGFPAPTADESSARQLERRTLPPDDVVDEILMKRARMQVEEIRPRDPKEDMRKLLGVLIAMQEEIQRRGQVDDFTINRLYNEMGVSGGVTATNNLITQLCQMLASDSGAYGAGGGNGSGSAGVGAGSGGTGTSSSGLDLQRFGIAPVKEPSPQPLGCVYPGAPEPEKPTLPSPYTGVGGVGLKNTFQQSKLSVVSQQQQQQHQSSLWEINQALGRSSFGGTASNAFNLAVLGGNTNFSGGSAFGDLSSGGVYNSFPTSSSISSGDIYAARRIKEVEIPERNADISSLLSQLPKSLWGSLMDQNQRLSGTHSLHSSSVDQNGDGLQTIAGIGGVDGSNLAKSMAVAGENGDDDDCMIIDEHQARKEAERLKRAEERRKLMEQPHLRKWTGANNPAVPANIRYSLSTPTTASNSGRTESWRSERSISTVAPSRPYSPPVMPIPANQIPMPDKKVIQAANDSSSSSDRHRKLSDDDEFENRRLTKTQKRRLRRERAMMAAEIKARKTEKGKELDRSVSVLSEIERRKLPRLADAAATWDDLGSKVSALINARKYSSNDKPQAATAASISGFSAESTQILPEFSSNTTTFSTPVTQYSGLPTSYPVSTTAAYDPNRPSYGLPSTAVQQPPSFPSNLGSNAQSSAFYNYYSVQSWPQYP